MIEPHAATPEIVRVYVDGHGVDVPPDATALDAVRRVDSAAADDVTAGRRALTDSRGLPIPGETAVHGGAIFRVVSARAARSAEPDDDAL